MRLLQIAPYAALVVLGEALIGSVPAIVAAREGGMGLGSALIVPQAAQVAGIAFGAVVAGHLVDRWSVQLALLAGSLLYYAGLIGVGHQPAHLLGWVVAVLALAGAGLGMMLTAAFAAAAALNASERPRAIALLLVAVLAAGLLVGGVVSLPGPPTLVVGAGVIVAGALAMAWRSGPAAPGAPAPRHGRVGNRLSGRRALVGGGLVALGVLATLVGIEPSRVSVAMVAGAVGLAGAASLDAQRLGLVIIGLVVVGAGVILLWVHRRPGRATAMAVAASAPAALAAAGLLAIAGFAMPRELSVPDSRGGPLGELAAVAGGAAGLVVGAWLLARGLRPGTVASAGSLVLAGLAVLVLVGAGSTLRSAGVVGPVAAIAATAFGGGLAAVALRLVLADAPVGERGFAAAAGVAAGSFGAMAGLMIGAGEGMALAVGAAGGIPAASVVLLLAPLAAIGSAAVMPGRRPPEASGQPDGVAAG